jgi:DNA/RNA endonuclease G (NUC1)
MRGKTARLRFELHGKTEVYMDNVFFKSEHLKFGNPSLNQQEARRTAQKNQPQPNNYLIEKPQYAVSYNDSLKTPNWASYKLDPSWLAPAGTERKGLFETDWSLPFDDVTVTKDYGAKGEKGTVAIKGHLVPNQDRGREGRPVTIEGGKEVGYSKDNLQTFMTTNVVPQPQYDTAWQQLEGDINKFVRLPKRDNPINEVDENLSNEVYIITGRYGSSDLIPALPPTTEKLLRSRATQFNIDVPEMLWKVVLIPEKPGQSPTDITPNAKSFGVLLPNINQEPSNLIWQDHVFSVNDIEEYTGYNFFSNIPTEVQEKIENQIDLPAFFKKK